MVWEGPSLHLRYHSRRRTSLATGFKAQYHILNKSLTEGQFNFITKSLRKTFEKHQIVRETFYGTFCLILSLVQNQPDFTRIFCHDWYIAPHIQGWNITAESISSTTVLVTWPIDNLSLSMKDFYGFVATCRATEIKDTLRLAATNSSSINTLVQRLLPHTEYRVQVIALSKGERNGSISMRSSSVVVLRTNEDGEEWLILNTKRTWVGTKKLKLDLLPKKLHLSNTSRRLVKV